MLDAIVEPLTKTYTAGGLDEKTRIDLMKFLAETHDPRTQPAHREGARRTFEMGKTDDETRVACELDQRRWSKAGVKLDQAVIDELWNVFAKFQISKATSERLYHAVQDAVLQVKDPSYADKAVDKLKGTVPPNPSVDVQKDQLMWWQLTSVQHPQRAPVHQGGQAAHRGAADADEDVDARRDHPVCPPQDGEGGRAGAHQVPQRRRGRRRVHERHQDVGGRQELDLA